MSPKGLVHRIALAFTILGMGILAVPAVPANAAQPAPQDTVLGHFKKPYSRTFTWQSNHLGGYCVKLTVSGNVTYTVTESFTTHSAEDHWNHQVVHDPTLKEVIFHKGCKRHRSMAHTVYSQHWTGYKCSFNPSISVSASAPAGVSVGIGGWPSCGNRNQASYSSPGDRGYHHTQFNSGSPIEFGQYDDPVTGVGSGFLKPKPCYGVYASTRLFTGGPNDNNDSFSAKDVHTAAKVCLNKI